jgi:predicted nucleotidyltransferase
VGARADDDPEHGQRFDALDDRLCTSTVALAAVPGVVGVTLGGSQARGTADSGADVDLGVYYRAGLLDLTALARAADAVNNHPVELASPGTWGPWVDGGAWLHVDGVALDWILRDLDRVDAVWAECQAGVVRNEIQTGHPLGFWSHTYCGELALARVLVDPDGALTRRHDEYATTYPDALADALVRRLWEARFTLDIAAKGARGADVAYVAGCLFRAVGLMADALHAADHAWVTNEKGLVALAARLARSPDRVGAAFDALAPDAVKLQSALAIATELLADVERAVSPAERDDRPV